jgi:hypothetical protein
MLGGEAVFRGTRVPLQHVAWPYRKAVPEREIAEDFPTLSDWDLASGRLVARFGGKPGTTPEAPAFKRAVGLHSDPSTARREYLSGIGRQTGGDGSVRSVGPALGLSGPADRQICEYESCKQFLVDRDAVFAAIAEIVINKPEDIEGLE